jgi:signal transduction histidine kinase/ActR/RegA family two-component response regulator
VDPAAADGRVNILLVDDQPAKLLSYEAILGELRENLIKAGSAKEALQQLLKTDVAVVLLDACMPEMDGFELAEMIRRHPRCRKTAIILVSAVYLSDFDRLRGYGVGAVDYVPVPIVPEVLRAKVSIFADLYRKTELLSRLNTELELRVAQRTSELEAAHARERVARQEAERASRTKDEFLATLSHELRTPINAVIGWAQLMSRGKLDAAGMAEGMRAIERGIRTQVQLIDDLLDVSRITSGVLSITHGPVDLPSVLSSAVETVRAAAQEKGLTLVCNGGSAPKGLRGDATRLQQVFWNLLHNAVKFTPAGGQVGLRLENLENQVRVTVSDTGEGIAPEFLPHVFERFRQADSSTTRAHGGLGLGLAIAKHLVDLHHGEIRAESDGLGRGSRFIVTLPVSTATASPAADYLRYDAQRDLSGLQVLVVDDNLDTRDIVARTLQDCGARTVLASSADEALQAVHAHQPDILICDIAMPYKDGYALMRELRAGGAGGQAPAIALTAYTRTEDRARALSAGYNLHVGKPVNPQELILAVMQLSRHRLAP